MILAVDEKRFSCHHKRQLRVIHEAIVHPKEFKEKWGVTNETIASLLGITTSYVQKWFLNPDAPSYREPDEKFIRHLSELDFILEVLDRAEDAPQHLKTIYSKLKKKQ